MEQGLRPLAARRGGARRRCRRCGWCTQAHEVQEAIASFGSTPVAVKPSGLTGGKGVKVMGPHLASHAEARDYALSLLAAAARARVGADRGEDPGRRVHDPGDQRRQDRASSRRPPTTIRSASTATRDRARAGWARCRCPSPTLPFMTAAPLRGGLLDHRAGDRATAETKAAISAGVMNSGFFATADGVKVIEFNARFGDPECMNIMSLFRRQLARGDGAHGGRRS